MLMTKQQAYLLESIRRLGCVRRTHLYALARFIEGNPQPHQVDAMLRQLKCRTDIRLDGELVKLPRVQPREELLEAVDVMLELAEGELLDFDPKQTPPILLRFTLGGEKLRLFAVVEPMESIPQIQRRKTERVILLRQVETPALAATLPDKHFYAIRQKDGTHRFFTGGGQ